jgi:leucyl-tRNA synthetase
MGTYEFQRIEKYWQEYWQEQNTFKVDVDPAKPKYYVLDMFPYPSGAGLHVGHPLGYISSDIYTRYKKLKGFNVLHPMGFDAFGLPAEQYAIQTGQHPAGTTEKNIIRYKEQLRKIGLAYDWDREVRTCDPDYYKWTQWTFIQLFHHWYNKNNRKAEPVSLLIEEFSSKGNKNINAATNHEGVFSASEWNSKSEEQQQAILMKYRLAYQADTYVNWCPALGTVLANDEVRDGYSVRGNHPVVQKQMKQWLLRITAYTERLLDGLDHINWTDSLKEMQRNWIGKSEGATLFFKTENNLFDIEVFTTRPDTIFGCTFMVLAPEHPLVNSITTEQFKNDVEAYIHQSEKRTERERLSEVKKITGVFTGSYAVHPFSGEKLPIWLSDYVLIQYGTGAVMSVPAHDSRDYAFAKHFQIPVREVVSGGDISVESYDAKSGKLINSDFLNGLDVKQAIKKAISTIQEKGIGHLKVNFKLRDAIFSRQRYWGEPFPVYYKNKIPYTLPLSELPLRLPEIDKFLPTETGEPPLGRAKNWKTKEGYPLELDTMPGFAGSCGYYLRYMDPNNNEAYFSKHAVNYWKDVDLYIGGTEHATGHLIYSRFWNKFLFDIGLSVKEEPFKKLINQGMIQGRSNLVYRVNPEKYAEHLLWEQIKDNKTGLQFNKRFKEGHREFDFFSPDAKLVIEIKCLKNIEKLSEAYNNYCKSKGYKLLLIPIGDIVKKMDYVLQEIKDVTKNKDVTYKIDDKIGYCCPIFISHNIEFRDKFSTPLHVDLSLVKNDELDIEGFKKWRPEYADAEFILEKGKYICGYLIEKMSKSLNNVVNPDDIIEKYGADTLRMYEMFLGPIEQSKPWNTDGIEGVHKFLKKFWYLFFDEKDNFILSNDAPSAEELKILHKSIKKTADDIEKLSLNTSVSNFMIAVNDLSRLKCHKKDILEPLLILLSPFAPHITEELWKLSGNIRSISEAHFPDYNPEYTKEDNFDYPVSVNGKLRTNHSFPINVSREVVETEILKLESVTKWTEGKNIVKIVFVPNKIINIVVQ